MIIKVAFGFGNMRIIVGLSKSTQIGNAQIICDFLLPSTKKQKSVLTFKDFSCCHLPNKAAPI